MGSSGLRIAGAEFTPPDVLRVNSLVMGLTQAALTFAPANQARIMIRATITNKAADNEWAMS